MSTTTGPRLTVDEYLARERPALERSKFCDGEIIPKPGGDDVHNGIMTNLICITANALDGTPFEALALNMRTRLRPGVYVYPDLLIFVRKGELAAEDDETLVNPSAIIEVTSPPSWKYDTGRKFRWYQETPSIQEIAFIDETKPRIQVFRRIEGGWLYDEAAESHETICLRPGGVALPLAEVYRNVEFPDASDAK